MNYNNFILTIDSIHGYHCRTRWANPERPSPLKSPKYNCLCQYQRKDTNIRHFRLKLGKKNRTGGPPNPLAILKTYIFLVLGKV